MFETEAEEWVKENMDCCKTDNSVNQSIPYFDEEERCCAKSAFQDGAELGYNKANEWHFVKDEVPISDKNRFYFVVDKLCKWNLPKIARFNEGVWSNLTVIDDVIAWKEIVLPELPKESE